MRDPFTIDRRAKALPCLGCGLAIAAFAAIASPCAAAVIDIAPDGVATTYASPMVFTSEGAQPLAGTPMPRPTVVDISRTISEAAQRQQISSDLITEVAWQESRFRQAAVSNRDAVGVMQLTAGAARDVGVDRYDTVQNIHGGAAYLRLMLDRYRGDVRLALAAYNAGPGAVDRYNGVPPFRETAAYVSAILTRLAAKPLAAGLAPAPGR